MIKIKNINLTNFFTFFLSDSNHNVRKACLISLDHLRMKAQNSQITYLKSKNILPLFYHFLQDPSGEIREVIIKKK